MYFIFIVSNGLIWMQMAVYIFYIYILQIIKLPGNGVLFTQILFD